MTLPRDCDIMRSRLSYIAYPVEIARRIFSGIIMAFLRSNCRNMRTFAFISLLNEAM